MSDTKEFIQIIHNRNNLNESDFEKYFNTVNDIIDKIVKYTSCFTFNSQSTITQESFLNLCWDTLEGKGGNRDKRLIDKLLYVEFENDLSLKGYLTKTFENLLLDTINRNSPGFQSRRKQMHRVLNPLCIRKRGKESALRGELWILKESEAEKTIEPPDAEQIMQYASYIQMPECRYQKSEDSGRGPTIRDMDMKNYMLSLLHATGGGIYAQDIDKIVTALFVLPSITRVTANCSDLDSSALHSDEYIFDIEAMSDDVMASICHKAVAEQMLLNMDEQMEQLIYYLYVKEMDQGQAAIKMGKSGATITNMKNSLIHYVKSYIEKDLSDISYEEGKIVFELIKELISKKRQQL